MNIKFAIGAGLLIIASVAEASNTCSSECAKITVESSCNQASLSVGSPTYTVTCTWNGTECGVKTCACTSNCDPTY